jgi:DNA-binding IclR family transcriptional regulator
LAKTIPTRTPQVVERTFDILDVFTPEHPEWTTTEIARACGLPIPTTHRILAALARREYISRDTLTKRFHLGTAALALGERARVSLDLRRAARPILERLSRDTDETALLTVVSEGRNRSVCLERVESSQPLRLAVAPGRQLPLHAGASQKILLAYMPQDEIERVLARPLERLCRTTVTDAEALRVNLAEIRRRGWAISFEETNLGAWGVAVPLLDVAGGIVASVGLAGPRARLSRAEVADHVTRLRAAATEIAQVLGLYVPKSDQ